MTDINKEVIRVACGVMIFKDGKILLGKRKGPHGAGEYSVPGGHVEFMESFENSVRREVAEECGVEIRDVQFLYAANESFLTVNTLSFEKD